MQDNSSNRRKTLIVSVLAFLLTGGGIFLFFIIQGSNDLTKAGKNQNFSYGEAAREGVSSFFKSMGVLPDNEEILAKHTEARQLARGFLPDGGRATADVSDWMKKPAASAAPSPSYRGAPTAAAKLSGGLGSSAGAGGGGSKSAGSSTRFGEGSAAGATSVSNKSSSGEGSGAGKGTLASLKNARALLGEGLRSDSAMTASAKWGQSFGVNSGSNRSGDMAYSKGGLVGLDKIKSGEIASLKMQQSKTGLVPEAGAFERDKEGEKKDSNLQAARDEASEKSKKDQQKQEIAKALADAGGQALQKSGSGGGEDKATPSDDPGKAPITDEEKEAAKDLAFFEREPLSGGASFQDSKVDITRNPDGTADLSIHGSMTIPGPTPDSPPVVTPYVDVYTRGLDGSLTLKED